MFRQKNKATDAKSAPKQPELIQDATSKKEVIIDGEKVLVDGFINRITLRGKTYALQCSVVEVHPISCPKCGGSFELKFGSGKCPYCNTYFTTQFTLTEVGK